ncbi:preprotein translocase subunit SecE [Candidatus Saccharibacteria bacterium]|nr:preprotein translocase subunit SecE [Candidatus Saccharibacteria bacterium]
MANKPRIRKALSVGEKAETARTKIEVRKKSSKLSKFGSRLLKAGFLSRVIRILVFIFWPLKKILSWLVPRYFINSWREVRQVTWPTRIETRRLTLAVLIFAIVFGSLVAGVDKILDEVFKKVILK